MTAAAIRIHPDDPVAVAISDLPLGTTVTIDGVTITTRDTIPTGHKVALVDIAAGQPVRKYGWPIGIAQTAIPAGTWIHSHNIKTGLSGVEQYAYQPNPMPLPDPGAEPTFQGYQRANGDIGIRNEIWIIPTVGCVNNTAQQLAQSVQSAVGHGVDAVVALTHPYGCSQLGDDHERTRRLLSALAQHPNAGGVLILGLGCENNAIKGMRELIGDLPHVRYLTTQDSRDEFADGRVVLDELITLASSAKRVPLPASKLRIGLKCGGSDGFSGITANSLLGSFSERLTGWGGTAVLTEVPEMFGAERILMARCTTKTQFDATVALVNGFKDYYLAHNQPVFENPSPGNKAGGITTLEEKSLGCVQKGGRTPVIGTIPYAGHITKSGGLCLLEAPGNDIVSVTALAAAGCHLVLFTTGRGTPLGGPVPVVKVASNSALAERKPGWIDFDAGRLLTGTSRADLLDAITATVIATANGKKTKAEERGQRDLAIFKDGVTL